MNVPQKKIYKMDHMTWSKCKQIHYDNSCRSLKFPPYERILRLSLSIKSFPLLKVSQDKCSMLVNPLTSLRLIFEPNSTLVLALPWMIARTWGWDSLTILSGTRCSLLAYINSCCRITSWLTLTSFHSLDVNTMASAPFSTSILIDFRFRCTYNNCSRSAFRICGLRGFLLLMNRRYRFLASTLSVRGFVTVPVIVSYSLSMTLFVHTLQSFRRSTSLGYSISAGVQVASITWD